MAIARGCGRRHHLLAGSHAASARPDPPMAARTSFNGSRPAVDDQSDGWRRWGRGQDAGAGNDLAASPVAIESLDAVLVVDPLAQIRWPSVPASGCSIPWKRRSGAWA
jgi:hypothetical protein